MPNSHCAITHKILGAPIVHLLNTTDKGVKGFIKKDVAARILALGISFTQALDLARCSGKFTARTVAVLAGKVGIHLVSARKVARWSLKKDFMNIVKSGAGAVCGTAVSVASPACFVPFCFAKEESLLRSPIDSSQKYAVDAHCDRTFLINLDKAADKLAIMQDHLDDVGIERRERFPAVYGKELTDASLNALLGTEGLSAERLFQRMPGSNDANKKARVGCYLSHLSILKKARAENLDKVLILEDDAILPQNAKGAAAFAAAMEEASGQEWDMLFLGFAHRRAPSRLTPHLDKVKAGVEMHAYIVNGKSLDKLIEILEKPLHDEKEMLIPCDELLSKYFETGGVNALSMHTKVGFQRPDFVSNITGTAKSDNLPLNALGMRIYGHCLAGPLASLGLPRWKLRTGRFGDLRPQ